MSLPAAAPTPAPAPAPASSSLESDEGPPPPDVVLRLRNVHKTYLLGLEGVPALRGVSLDVRAGEFIVILGRSGGGKTTLLNVLGTIDRPTRGELYVAGARVDARTPDAALARLRLLSLGFVFQAFNLLPGLTAAENVELPLVLAGAGTPAARAARARRLLARVGMAERAAHSPAQLSGGEQQRVTIARALANAPRILLLDEPTGDLDTVNSAIVLSLLLRLNARAGVTLVMVTHDVALRAYATRVVHVLDGRIARVEVVPPYVRDVAVGALNASAPVRALRQALAADRAARRQAAAEARGAGGGGAAGDGEEEEDDSDASEGEGDGGGDGGGDARGPAMAPAAERAARRAARARARAALGLPPEATDAPPPPRAPPAPARFAAAATPVTAGAAAVRPGDVIVRVVGASTAAGDEGGEPSVSQLRGGAGGGAGGGAAAGEDVAKGSAAGAGVAGEPWSPLAPLSPPPPPAAGSGEGASLSASAAASSVSAAFAVAAPAHAHAPAQTSTGLRGVAAIAHAQYGFAAAGAVPAAGASAAAGGAGGAVVVREPASYATHAFAARRRAAEVEGRAAREAAEAAREAARAAKYAALLAEQAAALRALSAGAP